MTLTPDVVAVLGAALLHTPTTIQGVSRACSLGECDHGDYADCPEVDIVVCEACHALVGDEDEVYPSEILADRCPVCVAVTAWWRGAGQRAFWTAELDDGAQVLVETFDGRTFTIASRPRALAGLPWSPPTPLEPGQ